MPWAISLRTLGYFGLFVDFHFSSPNPSDSIRKLKGGRRTRMKDNAIRKYIAGVILLLYFPNNSFTPMLVTTLI